MARIFVLVVALSLLPRIASAQCDASAVDATLMDSGPFAWDITNKGSIFNGTIDSYDGGFQLRMSGAFIPVSTMTMELGGRQIAHGPVMVSGLSVTRRVYVPATERWARFVDSFSNPTGAPITVTVSWETNMGSDGGTVYTGTSSGDMTFNATDRWVTTDDLDGSGDPSLSFNFWGTGGTVTPTTAGTVVCSSFGTQGTIATFDLTVPAGATVALMAFGSQNNNRADSLTNAMALDALPMSATFGLTPAETSQIVNWRSMCDSMDRDGDGVSCLAGDCDDTDSMIRPGAVERCNGRDDDCDAMRDEGFTLGTPCSVGVGFCRASGTDVCTADGAGTQCSATAGMPRAEVCNGIDDDCDGIDDLSEPGLVMPEICNGVDDDCDSLRDEGFILGGACTAGLGICMAMGTIVCTADGSGTMCSAMPGPMAPETCNGRDDDCDGIADAGETDLCAGMITGPICMATTPGAGFCGCSMDSDCGGPASGMVCNPMTTRCVMGCAVGTGRNDCVPSRFCTTITDGETGMCTGTCNFDEQCAALSPDRPVCQRPTGGPSPMNTCVACLDDSGCAMVEGRGICRAGTCVECTSARSEACATSEAGQVCLETGFCGCGIDGHCPPDSFCHGTMRRCQTMTDPDAGPPPVDSGPPVRLDAGDTPPPPDPRAPRESGCGCVVPGQRSGTDLPTAVAMVLAALLLARTVRRRRRPIT